MGNWKNKFRKKKEEGEETEDETTKKEETLPPVSISELYSTLVDRLLIFIGLLAATASGVCLPLMTYLFGDMTDSFSANPVDMLSKLLGVDADPESVTAALSHLGTYPVEVQKEINATLAYLDDVAGESLVDEINKFGYGTLGLGGAQLILGYIFVLCLNVSAERQAYKIRNMFLRAVLRQDISWYDTTQSGDFASRVAEDLNKLQSGIGEAMGMFVMFVVIFLGSLILAFIQGWKLTLVCLSCFPLLAGAGGVMATIATSMTSNELKAYGKAGAIAEEVFGAIRTIFAFGGQKKEVQRYEKALVTAKTSGDKKGLATAIGSGSVWLVVFGSFALAFWYGTKLIIDSRPPNCLTEDCREYTPGNMIVVFFSVMMGSMQIGMAAPYVEAFSVSRAAASSIYKIINRISPIDSLSEEGRKPDQVTGRIVFRNVYFNYPSRMDVKILQGLNLTINPGETVALVGSSGCGKSTTIQLIQRFYDPLKGEVYLDGHDIRDLNVGWIRQNIGVVGQEPVLFAMNILENIRQGKPNATLEEVERAAKAANAHDFIMKLPKTYETMVGERGAQLSGGQKQRIAIARALVRDPKILLLDEATSALDTRSEKVVQAALDKAREGRTTIVIAHRLSTVRNADRICAFQDGQVAEEGTHEELMEKKGIYYSLVTKQIMHIKDGESGESKDNDSDEDGEHPSPLKHMVSVMSAKSITSIESTKMSIKAYSTVQLKKMEKKQQKKDLKEVQMSRIMKMNSKEWHYILIGCIGAVVMGVAIPVYAIIFGDILGTFAEADNEKAMDDAKLYAGIFVALGVGVGFAEFCKTLMFSISGNRLTMRVRKTTFEAILKQEIGYFDDDSNNVGALCSRLSGDAANIQGATGSRLGTLIQSITTIILGLGLSIFYDWRVGLAMVGFIPLIIFFTYLESRIVANQSADSNEATEESSKVAVEAISNIRTVAGLHREDYFHAEYIKALVKPHKSALKKTHLRGLVFGLAHSVGFFAYATCMLYGGHRVAENLLEYDDLFKVAEALILGTTMVGQAAAFTPNYNKALASAVRLFKLLDRQPLIDIDAPGNELDTCRGRAGLTDVEFSYPNRPRVKVLRKMNLDIEPGKTVALVGSSGCGKSTVIQLLQRFYDPLEGAVHLEGVDFRDLELNWLRSQFGIVSQEPVLLDLSLAENIAYGDNSREVPMQEIIEAAKKANIHNFIVNLPQGYETPVGDRGTQLSGGQKQRVAIARALVRNPKVLLLDEATSALDTESEAVVNEALEEARSGRTCITIAHRLSTIKNADEILVVHSGRVVERGTHNELIARKGAYYRLYLANV